MGSAALDYSGNIAMGYSVASSTDVPVDLVHRPPSGRPARRDVAGRERDHRRNRLPGRQRRPLGRLQLDGHRTRPTSARSGTRPSTSRRPDWPPGRPGSAPSSSRAAPSDPRARLHGTVTDGTNPLAGVKVTAGTASTNDERLGRLLVHAADRHLRHDGVEVRLPAGLGQRHRGHGRRRRRSGLRALGGAERHGQRRREGRLGRRLAALREGRDQGLRRARPSPSTPTR